MWVAPIANGPYEKIGSLAWKGLPSKVLGADAHRWSHNSGSRLSGRDSCYRREPTETRARCSFSWRARACVSVCVFGFTCHDSTQSLSGQCTRRGISPLFKTGDCPNRPLSPWASGFCKTRLHARPPFYFRILCVHILCPPPRPPITLNLF